MAGCSAVCAVAFYALAWPGTALELILAAGAVLVALVPPVILFGQHRRHRAEMLGWQQQCRTADELSRRLQVENTRLRGDLAACGAAPGSGGDAHGLARLLGQVADEWRTAHERALAVLQQQPSAMVTGATTPAPGRTPRGPAAVEVLTGVEPVVFGSAGRRVHALALRALGALDRVEHQVEDPDQLHELFQIDHLVTQALRQAERLAVLGGQTSRRAREPLLMATVLRQAVAEIEHYQRVQVTLPDTGSGTGSDGEADIAVPGHAGPDVIHLLAELVENATAFSPPDTQVLMRPLPVPQGQMIEITDCGLSMSPLKLEVLNRLLASPQPADERARLEEGQIGLVVAARLAGRYGISVELRARAGGGTLARVVLPSRLLVAPRPLTPPTPSPDPTWPISPAPAPVTATGNSPGTAVPPAVGSVPVTASGAPPLSRRGPVTAPEQAMPPGHDAAGGAGRPALPRRRAARPPQEAHPIPAPPRQQPATPGPANPGLMASYTDGVGDAQADQPAVARPDDHHETRSR